jgi:hypothetical protein
MWFGVTHVPKARIRGHKMIFQFRQMEGMP